MNKVSKLELILTRNQEWIKTIDQKAGFFLAFIGVIITLVGSNIKPTLDFFLHSKEISIKLLLIASLLMFLNTIGLSLLIFLPKIRRNKVKVSISYFGDIAGLKLQDYKTLITQLNERKYKEDLLEQIHITSKVALSKHLKLEIAIGTACLGIIFLTLIYFLHVK